MVRWWECSGEVDRCKWWDGVSGGIVLLAMIFHAGCEVHNRCWQSGLYVQELFVHIMLTMLPTRDQT